MFKPVILAHRGASSVRYENTMSAFKKAWKDQADGIELDIQLTADGVPVVIHDADLQRAAGKMVRVDAVEFAELCQIPIGRTKMARLLHHYRIPTLQEAVSFCAQRHLILNAELKETVNGNLNCLPQVLSVLSIADKVIISSFDYAAIKRVKEIDPSVETAWLLRKKSTNWQDLDSCIYADGFHIHKRLMKRPYLPQLLETEKKLRVYGVSGKEAFISEMNGEIDGWITDYPKRFTHIKSRES